jgi:pentatricopeptide repeat protein
MDVTSSSEVSERARGYEDETIAKTPSNMDCDVSSSSSSSFCDYMDDESSFNVSTNFNEISSPLHSIRQPLLSPPMEAAGPPQLPPLYGGNTPSPKSRRNLRRPRPIREDDKGISLGFKEDVGTTVNQRLVEYFCIISSVSQSQDLMPPEQQTLDSNQDTNVPGQFNAKAETNYGNIHLPQARHWKKTDGSQRTFVPTITARYPETDYLDNPFNPMILHFCFPSVCGDVTIRGTTEYTLPRVHHFVLTLGCGHRMYGTCLTVLEEYDEPVQMTSQPDELAASSFDGHSRSVGIEIQRSPTGESQTKHALKDTDSSETIYVPKVLCLLSTWPYLTAFREYLSQLYRLAVMTNCMSAPLERYIVNVCREIPAPPPGAYEIQVSILDSIIRFWAPPAKLPIAYTALPFHILFECLDVEHIITVWTALMVERKVLLVSRQSSVLTVCAEILCSLLFPFRWSHLYVPMLPRMLCPMLDAPVPYLCGVIRDNWSHAQQFVGQGPETTVVVDLDRNTVELLGGLQDPLPPLPPRKGTKLHSALFTSVGEVFWRSRGMEDAFKQEVLKTPSKRNWDALRAATSSSDCSQWVEKLSTLDYAFNLAYTPESPNLMSTASSGHEEQSQWDRVQEAFLRFFVALMMDYRKYLVIPKKPDDPIRLPTFNQHAFMSSRRADNVALMFQFCQTQHYHNFLSRRMYSPGEPDLIFFDQSIDAKLNRSKMKLKKVETPFLHAAKVHKELIKLPAVPPNKEGLPVPSGEGQKSQYVYPKIPDTFNKCFFFPPRPTPKMISAEFDRQAILVSRLRANVFPTDDVDAHLDDFFDDECNGIGDDDFWMFYKGDYDPSPEVASFTVFLYVYSSLVGRDWQKYSKKRRAEEALKLRTCDTLVSVTAEQSESKSPTLETLVSTNDSDPRIGGDPWCGSFCDGECTENGAAVISNTMAYIGSGVEEFYSTFFRKPVDEIYTSLTLHEDRDTFGIPETDDAAAEFEEAREVATAQLEVAFETLATMSLRGLSVDSDAYFSLMEACGRCGDTKRALKLIELMKKDGFVADSEVLSCFIAAFAHKEVRGHHAVGGHIRVKDSDLSEVDAYSRLLTKGLESAKVEQHRAVSKGFSLNFSTREPPATTSLVPLVDDISDEASDWSSTKSSTKSTIENTAMKEWIPVPSISPRKKTKRKRKHRLRSSSSKDDAAKPVTEMVARHFELGESLLDFVYPNLVIDTGSDSCPHCSNRLTEHDVVNGWKPCAFKDYTTACPKCHHRFVPHFVVICSDPNFIGSQGNQTPLYCEFLSPWVLRKEFHHILENGQKNLEIGIEKMLNPSWRSGTDIKATLFWNLVACCRRHRLPFTFLLQGNFHNRLILPRKPDEM